MRSRKYKKNLHILKYHNPTYLKIKLCQKNKVAENLHLQKEPLSLVTVPEKNLLTEDLRYRRSKKIPGDVT